MTHVPSLKPSLAKADREPPALHPIECGRGGISRCAEQLVDVALARRPIPLLALIQCGTDPIQVVGCKGRLTDERENLVDGNLRLTVCLECESIGLVPRCARRSNERSGDELGQFECSASTTVTSESSTASAPSRSLDDMTSRT
jgi:hypothetical protein